MADDTPAKSTPASTPSSDASANYSRGENQKSVTQTYRDNWNDIFGKPTRTTKAKPAKKAAKKKTGAKKTAVKNKADAKKRKSKR